MKDTINRDADELTLRDYFAAKALPTVMMVCANDTEAGLAENITKYFAKKSYEMADAMLAEREKS